ncbi:MAG: hypothetical protein P4M10_05095 [Verrucomicrobiae bacterium]|nr:hypothetical protein [Verrucomicrobiae bacterium]
MNSQSNQPLPDSEQLNRRIATAVRSHRIKLRVLTGVAYLFGISAILASLRLVWLWRAVYWPMQEHLMKQIEAASPATAATAGDSLKRINELLDQETLHTAMVSMGAAAVALSVAVLGLGMLVLVTVVVLNRRVTLNQINASLAQISSQLRDLQRPQ